MSDLISRQEAKMKIVIGNYFKTECSVNTSIREAFEKGFRIGVKKASSAQPEVKPISYADCANAMMKMWIDNVLTDGEYNRIMDKLNAHEMPEPYEAD